VVGLLIAIMAGLAVTFLVIALFLKLSENSIEAALNKTVKRVRFSSYSLVFRELWALEKCPHITEKEVMSSAILLAGLISLIALITFQSLLFAVLIGVIGFIYLPKLYIKYKHVQLKRDFSNNLGAATSALSSSVRGGRQMLKSIEYTAEQLEGPVAEEFKRMAEDIHSNIPLPQAAMNMAKRIDTEEAYIFAESMSLLSLIGTSSEKASRLLETAANFVNEKGLLKERMGAATSNVMFGFAVCTVIPLVIAGIFYALSEPYRMFFKSGQSKITVLIFTVLVGIGWYMTYRLKKRAEKEI